MKRNLFVVVFIALCIVSGYAIAAQINALANMPGAQRVQWRWSNAFVPSASSITDIDTAVIFTAPNAGVIRGVQFTPARAVNASSTKGRRLVVGTYPAAGSTITKRDSLTFSSTGITAGVPTAIWNPTNAAPVAIAKGGSVIVISKPGVDGDSANVIPGGVFSVLFEGRN